MANLLAQETVNKCSVNKPTDKPNAKDEDNRARNEQNEPRGLCYIPMAKYWISQSDGLQPSRPYQTNQPITEHVTRGVCQLHKNLSFLLLVALIGSGLRSWDDNKNSVVANGLSQRSSLSLTKRIAASGNEIGLLAAPQPATCVQNVCASARSLFSIIKICKIFPI